MNFAPIVLEGFDGREDALAGIKRYIHNLFPVMFYRTNDLVHSRRVLWHLEEAIPDILVTFKNDFDVNFARTLALVHDDVETLTGDIPLHTKENINKGELEDLRSEENDAITKIVKMYNAVANGFDYRKLLSSAKKKDCLEAQFVSFFDKYDGGGEAWHEVWAGNHYFLLPAGGHHGQKGGYVRRLNDFPIKYPNMMPFFEGFPKYLPGPFDFKLVASRGKPHTESSLQNDSEYFPHERWKRTILKHEGIELLITQVEFY